MADRHDASERAWQLMLSGRRLDLLAPSPLEVEIADIAHGLARVARWNGQTSGDHAFSVAQHSLLVEQIFFLIAPNASPEAQLASLLHDAPEYVIGDMISPFKSVIGGDYRSCEERLQQAIYLRFSLPGVIAQELKKDIKHADQIAAYFEATELAGFSVFEATQLFGRPCGITVDGLDLSPQPAKHVQKIFVDRFQAIDKQRPSQARSR